MRRPAVTAAGFALAGGVPVDPSGLVHISPGADRAGRLLLACVEPTDQSPRGLELAAVTLRVIRDTFAITTGPPADALLAAFERANVALLAQNRPLATGRWQRRICVGATAVAIADRQIAVVQSPPSQAIFVQDDQHYAFPDLASWRGDFTPDRAPGEAQPLGFADAVSPRLYLSQAESGDLVFLCSTNISRVLAQDEEAVLALFGSELLTHDVEGSIDNVQRRLAQHEVPDAFACIVMLSRLPGRRRLGHSIADTDADGDSASATRWRSATPSLRRVTALAGNGIVTRGSGLRDWLADSAELISGGKARESAHGSRQLALAPGALSVRRYRESTGLPVELRAHLPRGPGLQLPARLLAVSFLLFAALGGTGVAMTQQKERERQAIVALTTVDAELRAATENPGAAMTALTQAERALDAARRAGGDEAEIARRDVELARMRDAVWRVRRFNDVERIGALPAGAETEKARLALFDRTLYIAAGDLYELDADRQLLVALLSSSEDVAGGAVGRITHVSIDGGDVVACDGVATYRRDATGRWVRSALPVDEVGGLQARLPIVTWGNASYAVSWDGDIVRFDQGAAVARADIWAALLDAPDLERARDLTVDGRIHVLVDDGRVLTFSRGELTATTSAFVAPVMNDPAFLAEARFASALYVVDRNGSLGDTTGRIVRVAASGDAWQYLAPPPAADDPLSRAAAVSLASAVDLAIDELSGTVYWIANGEIWRARLPTT